MESITEVIEEKNVKVFDYKDLIEEPDNYNQQYFMPRLEGMLSENSVGDSSDIKENIPNKKKILNVGDINPSNKKLIHDGYLDYLGIAYKSDAGYVMKPDFIWFTILSEISKIINSDPENYRKYFSETDEKQIIKVDGEKVDQGEGAYVRFDKNVVIEEILHRIPSGWSLDLIIPEFSTLTTEAIIALQTTFFESMDAYYGIYAYACGFSRVKIYGSISEYELINQKIDKILSIIPEFEEYLTRCKQTVTDIINNFNNPDFWTEICWTESGYGVQYVDGWFTKFYNSYIADEKQTTGQFQKHISKFTYKSDLGDTTLYSGIFTSTWEDGCYVPQYLNLVTK